MISPLKPPFLDDFPPSPISYRRNLSLCHLWNPSPTGRARHELNNAHRAWDAVVVEAKCQKIRDLWNITQGQWKFHFHVRVPKGSPYLGKLQSFTNLKIVWPFGDDFPNPNHDSRVRENSEVVII